MRAVLGLGRGLGLPVLAEGVETLGELKFLDACEIGQGYYIGRPCPIEEFGDLTGVVAPSNKPASLRDRSVLAFAPAPALGLSRA